MPELGEGRPRLGQVGNSVRWAGIGDWCNRLSHHGDCLEKQAAGKNRSLENQRACASKRNALCRESGLSASLLLCESTSAIRESTEESATRRALLSRSK